MKRDATIHKMLRKTPGECYSPGENNATVTVCSVFVEIDDRTGLAKRAKPVRAGGSVGQSLPAV